MPRSLCLAARSRRTPAAVTEAEMQTRSPEAAPHSENSESGPNPGDWGCSRIDTLSERLREPREEHGNQGVLGGSERVELDRNP
jgi:hypothetical protein